MIDHGSACEKADEKKEKMCRDPGSNQSNALPTELSQILDQTDKQKLLEKAYRE
jgi:hypothetical protein